MDEGTMNEGTMNRRGLLRGAGVAGAVALAGVAGASSASASEMGAGPVGSWLITHHDDPPGNQSKTMGVVSFAEGGVLINQDISPAGPAGAGSWVRQGSEGFKGTFWFGQPGPGGPGSPGFTARVQVRGRMQEGRISGTYRFQVFGPDGAKADSGTGTFSGRRIEA